MINRLLREARSWIDTPWIHNHQKKGEGVDCVNFISACATSLDLDFTIPTYYAKNPTHDMLKLALDTYLLDLHTTSFFVGNIIAFNYCGITHHIALATSDKTIIHASARDRKVVEREITKQQLARIITCYQLKLW
jgi:hypothetical protein